YPDNNPLHRASMARSGSQHEPTVGNHGDGSLVGCCLCGLRVAHHRRTGHALWAGPLFYGGSWLVPFVALVGLLADFRGVTGWTILTDEDRADLARFLREV